MRYVQDKTDEKKARVFLFILLVIFVLGLILTVPAQSFKLEHPFGENVNTYSLQEPIRFDIDKTDSLVINMVMTTFKNSDSVDISVYVDFPKKYYSCDRKISLVFENGNGSEISPTGHLLDRRITYKLNQEVANKACWWPIQGVVIRDEANDIGINISRRKTAFNDLIQQVPKE